MSVGTLSPRRTALGLATLLGAIAVVVGVVIGAVAGIGAAWHATNPTSGAPAALASAGPSVHVVIKNVTTPDGTEPAYVGPGGVGQQVLFQLKEGTPTLVTIVNDSDQPHTFTSAALGVNETIPPGPSTVHFTIDAKVTGNEDWECNVPCGAWVMAHEGYMMGDVEVVS
jgi:hypothetical protein